MPKQNRMNASTNIAFSLQAMVGAAMALLLAVYLTKFYVDVVLLPAGIMAIAIAAGRAFDAITDPIMGWISDRTKTRFGRRLPWIAVGVVGNCAMYFLLLNPPAVLPQSGVATWAITGLLLSFLFVTISSVPRIALAAEITQDQDERQSLFGTIAGFVAIGTVIGAVMPNVLSGLGVEDAREQMYWQSVLYVGAYLLANIWFLLRIKERPEFTGRGQVPLVPGVRRAWRNKPFRIMFISHTITAIPIVIPATLLPFYTQYVLQASDEWVGYFLLAYLFSGLLALPMWLALAAAKGKLTVWLTASFIAVTGGAMLFFMGPGDTRDVLFINFYVGLQSSVWLFVGGAMHADVIDYDELLTGKRREGQFSALWNIIPKFALIPGAAIPIAILGAVGYIPNAEVQSADVTFTISFLYALVPAMLNAVGLSIMWWYPLSEKRHAEIRAGVARHAQGESALDPISGNRLLPPGQRSVDEATAWLLDYFSPRELRRVAAGRITAVCAGIAFWIAVGVAGTIGMLGISVSLAGTLQQDPGPLPSLAIIVAGMALTFAAFHCGRIKPAARMLRRPVDSKAIELHLRNLSG